MKSSLKSSLKSSESGMTLFELLVIVAFLGAILVVAGSMVGGLAARLGFDPFNTEGRAIESAELYVNTMNAASDVTTFKLASCQRDTDGNGFGTCTFVRKTQVTPDEMKESSVELDCKSGLFNGKGCKTKRHHMMNGGQVN